MKRNSVKCVTQNVYQCLSALRDTRQMKIHGGTDTTSPWANTRKKDLSPSITDTLQPCNEYSAKARAEADLMNY